MSERLGGAAGTIAWLQGVTIAWMLVECGVALGAAIAARSAALMAFGADSAVELFSAVVVLLPMAAGLKVSKAAAGRTAGGLLFALAGVVGAASAGALVWGVEAKTSALGMGVTAAALVAMPVLGWKKRQVAWREGNRALAADAVQSWTCAYLAGLTLAGLAIRAVWGISWVDPAAALAAIPVLVVEGRKARAGEGCGCCE